MSERWVRVRAVVWLELRVQRREPLTILYMLVLALLAMAFAAAGPVELVRDRGAVPRAAAWSLMLASTAITAFGQVITTMVAATVVLRDRADRVADLLVTTQLTEPEYRLAKLLAALVMLALIYTAIPFGLVTGAMLGGGSFGEAVRGSIPPFVAVVLPTMLAIGALQFAVGVLSGRLWVIVGQGLVLIWLWTAAITEVGRGGAALVALLDPFGSAPLLMATREWSVVERSARPMPLTPLLMASRAVWLALGLLVAGVAIMRSEPRRAGLAPVARTTPDSPFYAPRAVALVRAGTPHWWTGLTGTASYVARWMLRDAGWRVLALLGAVNVGVHAAFAPAAADVDRAAIRLLLEHARLFLILLATIYAGELVWREREERSAPLFDALPVAEGALIVGRIAGAVAAQCVMVAGLVLAVAAGLVWQGAGVPFGLPALAASLLLLPFVAWMLLSLAVHVVVQQKVAGHLLVIAGWAFASVGFDATAGSADAGLPTIGWVTVCLLAGSIVRTRWRRETAGRL